MNKNVSNRPRRALVARLRHGADSIGHSLAVLAYRAQLGPAREAELRSFSPRR